MSDKNSEDYKSGFRAGRKQTEDERNKVWRAYNDYLSEKEKFRRAIVCAALPEIIRAPWITDGVRHSTADEMLSVAIEFADKAVARMDIK